MTGGNYVKRRFMIILLLNIIRVIAINRTSGIIKYVQCVQSFSTEHQREICLGRYMHLQENNVTEVLLQLIHRTDAPSPHTPSHSSTTSIVFNKPYVSTYTSSDLSLIRNK